MKQFLKIALCVPVVFFTTVSCENKEPIASENSIQNVEVIDGRLAFPTQSSFDAMIKQSIEQRKPKLITSNSTFRKGVETSSFTPLSGDLGLENARISGAEEEDSLVPDEYFANLLNDNREIQIDDNIVKITEEGTYICHVSKYNRLLEILKDTPKHGDSNNKDDVAGDSKEIESGIAFYDSFSTTKNEPIVTFEIPENDPSVTQNNSNARVSFSYLPQHVYDSFETHSFGKHTVVGKWIESAFGHKENQYVYFSNNERLKLSFFDVSYVVYKSIGIKAKAQHKTWIGWGGDLVSPEMRMGWDGIIFTSTMPYSPSLNMPKVDFGRLEFRNFGVDIVAFSALDGSILDPLSNDIKNAVDGAINDALSTTISKLYQLMRQNLGNQNAWEQNQTAAFLLHYPNKLVHVLGRHEEIENNTDNISKIFDWATAEIKFKNSGGKWQFPNLGKGTVYDIQKGSVYASCTRGAKTIGVRIIKD